MTPRLALFGGPAIRPQGPPDWPVADEDVRQALEAAYRDGSWGHYWGPNVKRWEERLGEYHGLPYVLACGSGTFAVELALRALKVGPGDEVILAAYDYPGNFLCVHAVGAMPVLVDLAGHNWNLDPQRLDEAMSPKTKAVIVSHLHGGVVPMTEVMGWAEQRGVKVIEDACQCPGAVIEGQRAGTRGHLGVLSFGGSKLLTAGRGGALLTRHADIHQRAKTYQMRGNVVCPLSELQAAVLLPQLDKLDGRNVQRSESVKGLEEGLVRVPGVRLFENRSSESVPGYYKVGLQFHANEFGLPRDQLTAAVRAEGVALDEGFRGSHIGRSGSRYRGVGNLVEASRCHDGVLVLHHPVLLEGPEAMEDVIVALEKVRDNLSHSFPVTGRRG